MHRAEFASDGPRLRPLGMQSREGLVKLEHNFVDDLLRRAFEDVDKVLSFYGRRRGGRDGGLAPNESEMIDGLLGGRGKKRFL